MKAKSAEKRIAILKAAFAVVTEKGYFETKVDDVARRAGIAKGTVYLYFKDKPDIYVGLVGWLFEQAEQVVREIAARPLSPQRKLDAVFSAWSDTLFSRPQVLALLSMENVSMTTSVMKRFHKVVVPRMRELIAGLAGVIRAGIAVGEFRAVDPMLAAQMFLSAFRAGVLSNLAGRPVKDRSRAVQELFLCGILADARSRRVKNHTK